MNPLKVFYGQSWLLLSAGSQLYNFFTESYDYGKFGWILDPEGNKIELWEPNDRLSYNFLYFSRINKNKT